MIFTVIFWKEATERAAKTAAQVFLALDAGDSFNLIDVDWVGVLGVAGGAAFLSYMTSIVSASITKRPTPSLVKGAEDA